MTHFEIEWNAEQVSRKLRRGLRRAVREIAFAVEAEAKERIASIPLVDTGAMMASVHVKLHGEDGRPLAIEKAKAAALQAEAEAPGFDLPVPGPANKYSAIVAAAVDYAGYHELGAPNANLPARPFLRPAADAVVARVGMIVKREIEL